VVLWAPQCTVFVNRDQLSLELPWDAGSWHGNGQSKYYYQGDFHPIESDPSIPTLLSGPWSTVGIWMTWSILTSCGPVCLFSKFPRSLFDPSSYLSWLLI
jgi:hypothetical protein